MINVVCAAMFFLWIIMSFVCGKKYHVITYVFWGVYVPLFLYQLNWSKLIDANECFSFDYIFVVFAIVLIIYSFFTFKGKKITPISGKICATSFGRKWALPINVIYLCLYLTENYLGSGLFFPGLVGVDIHTYSAPIISYFTTAQFLVLAYDYYYFKSTQKKTYLLFMLMIIIV